MMLDRFKNRHANERCVIVANGPSLNMMDLSFLRKETVIGLNKIYLGIKKFKFYPRYLVVVNEKVIRQSSKNLKELNCVKFVSTRGKTIVEEDALTFHIRTKNVECRFCRDISLGVREGGTVTYAALQVAYYLGFKDVVLIGLDHKYKFDGQPHESKLVKGPDPNHFSSEYFAKGQKWDNPNLALSEDSYSIAREIFEAEGRRILDATVDGACKVFEKVDYRDFFHVKREKSTR